MSKIFFTSDLHFYHSNVIKFCDRPYRTKNPFWKLWEWKHDKPSIKSVEIMNEALVANWNSVVGPDDEVYVLGDFSLAFRPVELFTKRLNGKKYLVPGNHDFCHSYNKKSRKPGRRAEWIKKYEDNGWIVLPEQGYLTYSLFPNVTGTVNICHLPYANLDDKDSDKQGKDKYADWRPADTGAWLLCGHVHEKWKTRGKMINVGVDVWDYKPVALEDLVRLIK